MRASAALFVAIVSLFAHRRAHAQGRPEAFPDVPLAAGSKPRYTCIVASEGSRPKAAYLLFDGSVENGYNRVYVWIPDDPRYGRPQAVNVQGKTFAGVNLSRGAPGANGPEIAWDFAWRQGAAGGAHRRVDYATGEVVENNSERRVFPVFSFQVGYKREAGLSDPAAAAAAPIDISIRGDMATQTEWAKVAEPFAPWTKLNFYMAVDRQYGESNGRLRFQARLTYGSTPCVVRALPDETVIRLSVSPYLEDPIFEDEPPWEEAFGEGIAVDVDYGWYDLNWDIECEGLEIKSHRNWYVQSHYYPFPKPTAASATP